MEEQKTLLQPYRVLDLAEGGALVCGKMMGDLGADVIKIESPRGSPSRNIGPFYKDMADPKKSLFWFAYNTNKRGITLDIEKADGRHILRKLVKKTDILVESFPPGYLDKLEIGFSELRKINPRLIMTSISAFGQSGPYSGFQASDLSVCALGGFVYLNGDPDRAPVWISFPQAFLNAGAEGALASMLAIQQRERTGQAQHVDVSAQECMVWSLASIGTTPLWDVGKTNVSRSGDQWKTATYASRVVFPCKDGYVLCMVWGGINPVWHRSCQALTAWMVEEGRAPEWLKSFDWVADYDSLKLTQDAVDRLEGAVGQFFLDKTKHELYEGALKRRILLSPVSTAKDLLADKQLESRGYWIEVDHPELGARLTYCGPFVKLSEAPWSIRRRAPLIGEHNLEIYSEIGLSRSQIVMLKETGAI